MKRTSKYHLGLVAALLISVTIIGSALYYFLQKHAKEQVISQASMLMEAALAMRKYTITEIKPLLALQNKRNFLPQSVPSYAATKNFDALREQHSEYRYKEATLNPTNPRDRAADWEADIIQEFRNNQNKKNITLVRNTPIGTMLYYARPIQIKDQSCLSCHGMIDDAPKTMIDLYGPANGFGWKMNEVVGSQIVSVPFALAVKHANETFLDLMSVVAGVFLVLYLALIIMFRRVFIGQPAAQPAVAVDPSSGNMTLQPDVLAQAGGLNKAAIQGSRLTQESSTMPERVVAPVLAARQEPVAKQETVSNQGRVTRPDSAANLIQSVMQDSSLASASAESRNKLEPQDRVAVVSAAVSHERPVPQHKAAPQPKTKARVANRQQTAEASEQAFHFEVAEVGDTVEEQTISLKNMYQNHPMTELLVDEALGIDDAITELPLGAKLERDKR